MNGKRNFTDLLERVAQVDDPVSLYGPKSKGKDCIAETIHDLSARRHAPFLIINCYANDFGATQIEISHPVVRDITAIVFGGQLELLASLVGGTVLINDLHLLTENVRQAVRHLFGALKVRMIESIPRSLSPGLRSTTGEAGMEDDRIMLQIPTLRFDDVSIQFFSHYFLEQCNNAWNRQIRGFTDDAMQALIDYPWPGIMGDLRDMVRQAALLTASGQLIDVPTLPAAMTVRGRENGWVLKRAIQRAEYEMICQTLLQTRNNKRKAAELLQISRKTLYAKMRVFEKN